MLYFCTKKRWAGSGTWRHPGETVGMETSSPPPPTPGLLHSNTTVHCLLPSCPGRRALTNTHVHTLSTHTYTCTDAATLPAPRTRGGRGQRQRLAGGQEAGRRDAHLQTCRPSPVTVQRGQCQSCARKIVHFIKPVFIKKTYSESLESVINTVGWPPISNIKYKA